MPWLAPRALGKSPLQFASVVGLPDQITERDAVAMEMLLDAEAKTALAAALRRLAKAQNNSPLRTSRAVYCTAGRPNSPGLRPVVGNIVEILRYPR